MVSRHDGLSAMELPSNRDKKRTVAAGLRLLKNKPGWDPAATRRPDPEERLKALGDTTRRARTYQGTQTCAACAEERTQTADETALCEAHLMEAMGL